MNDLSIKFSEIDTDETTLSEIIEELSLDGKVTVKPIKAKSFNGFEDIILLLSIGGGVTIKQIANIVISYINKNSKKKFKCKGMEFTGYSANEINKIVKGASDESRGT